ncbi:IS110 family transposase [Paracoccus chinensis]|uniref:Transposase n=1 Tax=Paracoccus chinensis TaxID=525640 RepID=A0A1G9MH51_9RHOB|nr:IS110 family transposase [Paracoccus chinensis]SDL73598.1 Transposase [Paracoccus chinensis]
MPCYAALDVSQETTAICVVDEEGHIQAEKKLPTCPDAIAGFLARGAPGLVRVGMETGPMAVWLWNELAERQLPIICLDARHANAALKMRPVKTDRNDAAGLAQIVRTGWFKQVRIKTRSNYQIRSLLTSRETLVRIRVKIENELRGLLRTFGVLFGKRVGSFTRCAGEIISGELDAAPEMRLVAEVLMKARASILDQIKVLDRRLSAIARETPVVRLFMTAPGVGVITALSVASVFDDAARFRRSSSAGAYLGLTPRRYESGETSRNGRISRQGNQLTRTHLYEAATTLLTRNLRFSTLKAWGMRLARASGFKKARVAVARKLAVILHAMWKTNTPFRWSEADA